MTRKYIYVLSELSLGEDNLPTGWTPVKYCASGMAVWSYLTHNGHSHSKLSVRPSGEKDMVMIARLVESSDSTELKRHNEPYDNPLIGYSSEEYDEFFIVHRHEIFGKWNTGLTNTVNGHEFVDLGLPSGLLWATCNVGATDETEPGLYFAWGETTGHEKGSGYSFSSDNYNAGPGAGISTNLTLEQDAAHACLGGNWRMPTADDFQELINGCYTTWVTDYKNTGVNGRLFTSRTNGNTLFFPAAGYYSGASLNDWGSYGYVWSSTFNSSSGAYYLYFASSNCYTNGYRRFYGYSVRGVCQKH